MNAYHVVLLSRANTCMILDGEKQLPDLSCGGQVWRREEMAADKEAQVVKTKQLAPTLSPILSC